jgi:hypothetical protein
MIETIATIDILNSALDKLNDINYRDLNSIETKVVDAKDTLITYRDKLQKEVDEFDEWAKVQSDIDTALQLEAEEIRGK